MLLACCVCKVLEAVQMWDVLVGKARAAGVMAPASSSSVTTSQATGGAGGTGAGRFWGPSNMDAAVDSSKTAASSAALACRGAAVGGRAGSGASSMLHGGIGAEPLQSVVVEAPGAEAVNVGAVLAMQVGGQRGGVGLSAGQQQLLCLARMLLQAKSIVLLDECTSSVDAATSAVMRRVMAAQLRGCTVLHIAHDLRAIQDYDRVLVMDCGRLVEQGAPRVLLADPTSSFAALHQHMLLR